MILSAVNPFSLLDYPSKVSCVVFTPWCNFCCPYCHNKELVLPSFLLENKKNIIPEKIFFRFLEKRKGLLDGVSICWWEPTLQKDLWTFCAQLKSMGFLVKLDTNGVNPSILKKLLKKQLLDYIAMDIKSDFETYNFFVWKHTPKKNILESIDIVKNSWIEYEFRTTYISPFHTSETVESIWKLLQWTKKYYLQNFREGETLDSNFSWKPFSQTQLEAYKKIIEKYIVSVEIRI